MPVSWGRWRILRMRVSPVKAGAQACGYLTQLGGSRDARKIQDTPAFTAKRARRQPHPATAANATPQNAKGARHCCQAPCRRTAAVDPDGSFGKVSAAPPLAPARACELRVGRRGWPLSTHPEGELRLPAPAARFVSPAGTGNRKPCWTLFSARSLQVLPRRLRAASGWPISRRSVPSFPKPSACAPISANQGSYPFRLVLPASSRTCVPPSAAFPTALARRGPLLLHTTLARPAPLPVEPCSAVPRNLGSAWAALRLRNLQELSHPRTVPECGFPKAPAPFPARVSF